MSALGKSLLALGLLSTSLAAQATMILDGDGFTVAYDETLVGPYGQAAVSGDTVYFLPTTFTATSGVPGGTATTQAIIQLSFTADPGYAFTGLSFVERGDYLLYTGGGVDVDAGVLAVDADTAASASLLLSPDAPLDLIGFPTHNWELAGDLSLLGLDAPSALLVTLDNTLFASTPNGGLGFIEKKFVGFRLVTQQQAVPEPASLTLLLAGALAALLAGSRRRLRAVAGRRG